MEKERSRKVMEQEGQHGAGRVKAAELGDPSAKTTSDSLDLAYGFSEGSRTYQIHGTGNQGTHCLRCVALPVVSFCLGPYRRPVYPFLLTAALILAKEKDYRKALTKQQVPERKDGMGIYIDVL